WQIWVKSWDSPQLSLPAGQMENRFRKSLKDCWLKYTGPIVQWIEFQIPVLKIWVRIPMGSLMKRLENRRFFYRHGRNIIYLLRIFIRILCRGICFGDTSGIFVWATRGAAVFSALLLAI